MNTFSDILAHHFLGDNEPWRLMALAIALLVAMIAGRVGQFFLRQSADLMAKRGRLLAEITFRALTKSIPFIAFTIGLKVGLAFLRMNPSIASLAATVHTVMISLSIGFVVYCLVDVLEEWLRCQAAKTESKLDDMLVPMVRTGLRITVVVLVILQIAQSLTDKPLTSILAGLGVGGLAVALAAQDTIKHFFGSLVLFTDKPFEMGDRVVVDGTDGVVEVVGFRSTRLRTMDGHLVTIPNGDLANKVITNISRRPHIRRLLNLAITYDTPPEKMELAKEILTKIFAGHEGGHPDFPPRVYFSDFNNASLNIMVLYWYHSADYWKYMDFTERVNLEILRQFKAEGLDFAFPTQTLFLAGDPKRPLSGEHLGSTGLGSTT